MSDCSRPARAPEGRAGADPPQCLDTGTGYPHRVINGRGLCDLRQTAEAAAPLSSTSRRGMPIPAQAHEENRSRRFPERSKRSGVRSRREGQGQDRT
jgi:hypothetical protein